MEKIIEYLQTFFDSITTGIETVFNAIKSMIDICKVSVGYVKDVLSILPSWLYAIILVLVTVCVIYKVLGREGDS